MSDELNRLEIFLSSVTVGEPFSVLACIIQIEHGGHGIDTEAVNMIFIQPKQGIGNKIIADFLAPVIINEGSPLRMGT